MVARRRLDSRDGGLEQQQTRHGGIGGEQLERRGQRPRDPLAQPGAGVALEGDRAEQAFLADLVGGCDAVPLVLELLVEGVPADPGHLDDLLDRGRFEPVPGDDQGRSGKQPSALVRGNDLRCNGVRATRKGLCNESLGLCVHALSSLKLSNEKVPLKYIIVSTLGQDGFPKSKYAISRTLFLHMPGANAAGKATKPSAQSVLPSGNRDVWQRASGGTYKERRDPGAWTVLFGY